MKYAFFVLVLAIVTSCNQNSKKTEAIQSTILSYSLTDKEAEYLKTRDAYIKQFEPLQKAGLDTLDRMDDSALQDLEKKIREILKDSKYSTQGEINLVTLQGYMGFGQLDGLSLEKDSMKIFYTTKNLFLEYFKKQINPLDSLSSNDLEEIFRLALLPGAALWGFYMTKIPSTKNTNAYIVIGQVGNMNGPGPPRNFFALMSTDKYVYMITPQFDITVKELPHCKAVWDSIGMEKFDTAFEYYRKCYQEELSSDPQFEKIQKQLERMVKYLEP